MFDEESDEGRVDGKEQLFMHVCLSDRFEYCSSHLFIVYNVQTHSGITGCWFDGLILCD